MFIAGELRLIIEWGREEMIECVFLGLFVLFASQYTTLEIIKNFTEQADSEIGVNRGVEIAKQKTNAICQYEKNITPHYQLALAKPM